MDTIILAPQLDQTDKTLGDTYLKFQLEQQIDAALPIEYTQEVLIVQNRRITPMPNMPECVMGLLNRRNRISWVIDLAKMLKLKTQNTNLQQYNIVITRVGQASLGLVVQEIKGVARLTPSDIESSPTLVPSNLKPYLSGCIQHQQELLLVLNAQAVVNSPILHN